MKTFIIKNINKINYIYILLFFINNILYFILLNIYLFKYKYILLFILKNIL